jgi:hypothetical protein
MREEGASKLEFKELIMHNVHRPIIALLALIALILVAFIVSNPRVNELQVVVFHYSQIDENGVEMIVLHEMIIPNDQVDTKVRQEIDRQARRTLQESNPNNLVRIRVANAILRAPADNPEVQELVGDKWTAIWSSQ